MSIGGDWAVLLQCNIRALRRSGPWRVVARGRGNVFCELRRRPATGEAARYEEGPQ